MNVEGIEVSSFCSGCALFEYVIRHEYVSTDKRRILAYCSFTNAPQGPREKKLRQARILDEDNCHISEKA